MLLLQDSHTNFDCFCCIHIIIIDGAEFVTHNIEDTGQNYTAC